jgi:hypothetical protein
MKARRCVLTVMIIMLALACAGRAAATGPVTAAAVMAVAFRPGGIVSDRPCALRAMIIMLTWDCAGLSTKREPKASPNLGYLEVIDVANRSFHDLNRKPRSVRTANCNGVRFYPIPYKGIDEERVAFRDRKHRSGRVHIGQRGASRG